MKYYLPVLAVIFTSAYANEVCQLGPVHSQRHGIPESDATVYSQTYSFDWVSAAISIYGNGNRRACDDFILDDDYYIDEVYVWVMWTGEHGSFMNLAISEDDANDSNPNTNTVVWAESVPCTSTFTGDSQWGYDFYEVHCYIDAGLYPELTEGAHYYFEVQAESIDNVFILTSPNLIGDTVWYDEGDGVWIVSYTYFGTDMDLFFDFYGEPLTSLQSETWGSIKTLF